MDCMTFIPGQFWPKELSHLSYSAVDMHNRILGGGKSEHGCNTKAP